jgi:transglutaminase-like putative cysteine protease
MTTTHARIAAALQQPAAARPSRYQVLHTTAYSYSEPVPVCHNEVHLAPRPLPRQRVLSHRIDVDPAPTQLASHLDYFGNDVGRFSIEQGHDRLWVRATSRVEVDPAPPWHEWPSLPWESVRDQLAAAALAGSATADAVQFRLDSPHVRRSAQFADWAGASFQPGRPWAEAFVDLTARIHREFAYDPEATTTGTPVDEVFALRRGVCQDFAHLEVACLRSLGLAARYVSGYLSNERSPAADGGGGGDAGMVGADASHAWVSCWGGDAGWFDLDPTNDCAAGHLHITLGWGRDYGDVCPIKGVYVGGGRHSMQVAVQVSRLDRDGGAGG